MSNFFCHEYLYLGWEITVRCTACLRPIDEVQSVRRYTASAIAILISLESGKDWIDPRAQVLDLGERCFATERLCANTLLAEVKELIDALRR